MTGSTEQRYFKVDGSMEKKWDTVIPADLKRKWDIYVPLVTKGLSSVAKACLMFGERSFMDAKSRQTY